MKKIGNLTGCSRFKNTKYTFTQILNYYLVINVFYFEDEFVDCFASLCTYISYLIYGFPRRKILIIIELLIIAWNKYEFDD